MKKVLRLEILIDSVATNQIVRILQRHPQVTFSVYQASTIQTENQVLSRDDFSHSIAYHCITMYIPEKVYTFVDKALKPLLEDYAPSAFLSECKQISSPKSTLTELL